MAKQGDPPQIVRDCQQWFQQDRRGHDAFVAQYERGLKTYHGIMEPRSGSASWTNKQRPRYAHQIGETLVASMIDPDPKWRCKARPRMASPEEIQYYRDGARAHELLLSNQADTDRLAEKQRPFALQAIIGKISVVKSYWRYEQKPRTRPEMVHTPVVNDYGELVDTQSELQDVERDEVCHDDPTAEVIDSRDFIWHQGATSLDRALRVHQRCWYTLDEIRRQQDAGVFDANVNLEELKRKPGNLGAKKDRDGFLDRGGADRAADYIEVIETWCEHGRRCVTWAGGGDILLADRPNPFHHQAYPYVVASTNPGLFDFTGTAEIEVIADLQEILWSLLNQSLDYLQLVNNPIVIFGPEVEDPDDYEFYPGAVWTGLQDPSRVQLWAPQGNPNIALPWMEKIMADLQNIPGASAALLGQADPSTQTATEVSTTTTMAMRRVLAKKQQIKMAWRRVGEQWIELNQQYIKSTRVVETVGTGGVPFFEEIDPSKLQGRYYIDVEQMDESMIRQERLAETTSRLQVGAGTLPAFIQARMVNPEGKLPNIEKLYTDVLEAGGISDTDAYFIKPQMPAATGAPPGQPPGMPGQPQQGQLPPGNPNGAAQTAPQAYDMNSPSNGVSQSPAAAMQRLQAMSGGMSNAGG